MKIPNDGNSTYGRYKVSELNIRKDNTKRIARHLKEFSALNRKKNFKKQ